MLEAILTPDYDAILIPGGGVREGGGLPPWVEARLNRAMEVYSGEYLVALSAGTPHRPPPRSPAGYPIFESRAAARYLVERGAPAGRVLTECHSYDTIGNAYFARTIHADPAGWRRLLVITSEFHMARAKAVFRWVFGLSAPPGGYDLEFDQTPNTGMEAGLLDLRLQKERSALDALPELTNRITTLPALHRWLFTGHRAYSTAARDDACRPLEEPLRGTY